MLTGYSQGVIQAIGTFLFATDMKSPLIGVCTDPENEFIFEIFLKERTKNNLCKFSNC